MGARASALDVLRRGDRVFISVDSLVDMVTDMASHLEDGPGRNALRTLAGGLFSISSYAEIQKQTASDGSTAIAHRCETCNAPVIGAHTIDKKPVTVEPNPTQDGAWFPFKVEEGRVSVAPWRDALDGLETVRLAEHKCAGAG